MKWIGDVALVEGTAFVRVLWEERAWLSGSPEALWKLGGGTGFVHNSGGALALS